MDGFTTALKAEIYVALRNNGSRVIVLLPAVVVMLQLLLTRLTQAGQQARDTLLGGTDIDAQIGVNAYGHYVDGLTTGLMLLALILVAWSAYSFSFDRDTGAIRHMLIRRVSRRGLLLAKLCHLHITAITSALLLLICTTVVSASLWQFGPVVEDGYELIGSDEIQQEILLGLKLALIPLPTSIAFGLLISILCQSATQAVTTALGCTIALDIFKGLLGDFSNYLYVSYQPSLIDQSYLQGVSRIVRGYSDVMIDEKVMQMNLWIPIPEMLLFVLLALLLIQRKKM